MKSLLTSRCTTPSAFIFTLAELEPLAKTLRNFFLLAALALFATGAISQTPGSADPSWTVTPLPTQVIDAIALQPDGKVVAVARTLTGTQDITVHRFDYAGKLDASFGTAGSVRTQAGSIRSRPTDIVIDPTGRIYVTGSYTDYLNYEQVTVNGYAVVRYLADGSLDASFGAGGIAKIPLNADKAFDPSGLTYTSPAAEKKFGESGLASAPRKIALQPDGKLVLMTSGHELSAPDSVNSVVMVRFNTDGQLDPSFANNGLALTRLSGNGGASTMRVASDGSLFVTGCDNDSTAGYVFKFTAQGSLDAEFGPGGKVDLQPGDKFCPLALAIRSDNKVIVGGRRHRAPESTSGDGLLVLRLNANGALDTSFGTEGYSFHDLTPNADLTISLAMERDGKILVAGNSDMVGSTQGEPVLMRLTRNGQLDPDFGTAGIAYPEGYVSVDLEVADAAAYLLTRNVLYGQSTDPNLYSVRKFITSVVDPTVPPRISGYSSQQGPSESEFAIAIRDSNDALITTLPLGQAVNVTGYVFPQVTDENALAHIFVVAATPFGWFMLNPDGKFVAWDGRFSSLVLAYESQPLDEESAFDMFTGKLPVIGTYRFYLAYMRVDSGELIYTANAAVVEVTP